MAKKTNNYMSDFSMLEHSLSRTFSLKDEDKKMLIKSFIESGSTITRSTQSFIIEDEECVKSSIDRDIDSVRFVRSLTPEIEKYARDKALEKGYVLHEDSPYLLSINCDVIMNSVSLNIRSADYVDWDFVNETEKADKVNELLNFVAAQRYILHRDSNDFLTKNYIIAKNSINLDVYSVGYIDWYSLKRTLDEGKMAELRDLVAEKGYVLYDFSPSYLRGDPKVVLASVKKELRSWRYADDCTLFDPEVFDYLVSNGVSIPYKILSKIRFDRLQDESFCKKCFEQLHIYKYDSELYKVRLEELLNRILNTYPTIKSFESIFKFVAELEWKRYKKKNANDLENLFGKISSELRNSDNFIESINGLNFLKKMKETLGDRYDDFYQAMKEYYDIYHSDVEDKLDKMQPSQDKISYYAALYCGKRKDDYIKDEISDYNDWLRQFFTLRLDNPTVDRELVQKQREEEFRKLYLNDDDEVCNFLKSIVQKYSQELDIDVIIDLIQSFVESSTSKLEQIIAKPDNYDAYVNYEKAGKLIKRLNLGYISFSGPEVKSYKDVIGFDEEKGKYVYIGVSFSEEEKEKIENYKRINQVFEKIKRDIVLKIKNMQMKIVISKADIANLAERLPFTDEYFEFNKDLLSTFTLVDLHKLINLSGLDLSSYQDNFENNEAYDLLNNYLIKNSIIWLLLFNNISYKCEFGNNKISADNLYVVIDHLEDILSLANDLKIELSDFSLIYLLAEISECADVRTIDILGLDIIERLCKELSFTGEDKEYIVSTAERLVAMMAGRSMSTVPYVSGETDNYKYSIYDSQDVDVLLAGINTDACFRVDGNDNDFLHYCCLDKNGFVIKITDKDGNFIARAGGFRNGNCVFLNQLRTIYDECGNYYSGEYENETNEIIETLRKVCEEIVRTSQENELEKDKIDHVFVTRSYSLKKMYANVSESLEEEIGDSPMENESQDWRNFVSENYDYLHESIYDDGFTTDYGEYRLICMASVKNVYTIEPEDLRFGDVDALYERTRNKIIATTNIDSNIMRKIKKIKGIDSYLKDKEYEEVMIPEGSTVFVGDNLYCIYSSGQIVDSCVLESDEKAKREFGLVQDSLDKLANDMIQQQIKEAQVSVDLQSDDHHGYSLKKVNEDRRQVIA